MGERLRRRLFCLEDTIQAQAIPEIEILPAAQQKHVINDSIKKHLSENNIVNLDIPVSETWINDLLTYQKDTLPDSLVEFLKPIYEERYGTTYFDFQRLNLDDDTDAELLLFFYVNHFYKQRAIICLLDTVAQSWKLNTIIDQVSRDADDEMMPVFISDVGILACKSHTWGSGGGGYLKHFYKKVRDKWYNVLDFQEDTYSGNPVPEVRTKAYYSILSPNSLNLTFVFNYYQENRISNIYLLKDKRLSLDLKWNEEEKKYLPDDRELVDSFTDYFGVSFLKFYRDELNFLKKQGTDQQKEILNGSHFQFIEELMDRI